MISNYDLDKIKFATDELTFEKAVALYEDGKVTQFDEGIRSYAAVVLGAMTTTIILATLDKRIPFASIW